MRACTSDSRLLKSYPMDTARTSTSKWCCRNLAICSSLVALGGKPQKPSAKSFMVGCLASNHSACRSCHLACTSMAMRTRK